MKKLFTMIRRGNLEDACALELVRGRDCGDGQSVEKFAENLS